VDRERDEALFKTGDLELEIDYRTHRVRAMRGAPAGTPEQPFTIDMHPYHVLRTLLIGVLDEGRTNYINAARGA
jgi:hypothetical protein